MHFLDLDCAAAESRIRAHVIETPVLRSQSLGALVGGEVFLKLENGQETGSFKLRGATHRLLRLDASAARRGVVTASSGGNHALGVAATGRKLGIPTEVFVPSKIDPARRRMIEGLNAKVRLVDGDCLLAEVTARREGDSSQRVYVSPYNDGDVIAGQGSIAVELLRQLAALDAVFVAVGGGGLIGGIGAHLKRVSPRTEVIGCWPQHSRALYECLRAGKIIEVEELPTWSVSTAGGVEEDSVTLPLAQQVIDRHVLVSEQEILDSLRAVDRDDGQLVEGAAGVALAALRQVARDYRGKTVAVILCGGNADARMIEAIRAA